MAKAKDLHTVWGNPQYRDRQRVNGLRATFWRTWRTPDDDDRSPLALGAARTHACTGSSGKQKNKRPSQQCFSFATLTTLFTSFVTALTLRRFIFVLGRAPAACPRRQDVLAGGRPGPRATRAGPAGPPSGFPTRGPELLGTPTPGARTSPPSVPSDPGSLSRGKAVRRASPRQEGRGGLRGMTRDNPGLSPASPAPLDPDGGDTAGTRRGSSPPLPASRRGAGVRWCILCDILCDRRGCAAYIIPAGRTRTPHYIRDRAPAGPRGSPAGGRGDGGREKGRDPAAAPAEPLVNPLPVAFTRHGTFPERANVPPTSGNSHRGAARTRTLAHAPGAVPGVPAHTRTSPVSGTPAGTRWQPGHIPSLRHLQCPCPPPRRVAPGPPPARCPPIRSRGAGGRGECPVGPAPPRAPLPGGDHAHSPPQEGITQGSLLLICIHLQAGYSPHFLTACHRQRPVPAVSPSCAGSAGRAAGRGAPGTVPVPASARSPHRGNPFSRVYRLLEVDSK
ncbi:uncharacterized protein [Taeniopygia guttata]|uniref:uncharacterized protein n=1 Tax=Taeniopygia guttata TaxID=59729 RepID=UPI003BB89AC3